MEMNRYFTSESKPLLKDALCSFGEENQTLNCNIYNINEVIDQTNELIFIYAITAYLQVTTNCC